jgi:hypothetical protein
MLLSLMIQTEGAFAQSTAFDIAPFARRCCVADRHSAQTAYDYDEAQRAGERAEKTTDGRYIYGLQWAEERDIQQARVQFHIGDQPKPATVQYWFRSWPYPPPVMPHIEDPADDPWQGKWITAATVTACKGSECSYRFLPLDEYENPQARNLPGVDYRRTLKLRLVFDSEPEITQVAVFSGSQRKTIELRVELGAGEAGPDDWRGNVRIYNGVLTKVALWNGSHTDNAAIGRFQVHTGGEAKGLFLTLIAAKPSLSGSKDITIVTMDMGERTFSFAVPDVEKGPVYVPDFHIYVTLAADLRSFSPSIVRTGEKIREQIPLLPEQTYERASKEIPQLDPVARESGGPLYLPLAADSSWQKFAFEWGGNVHVSKLGTKAMGAELKRLEWAEDKIQWRIGIGARPSFRPLWQESTLSVLDDYLPIATATWTADGLAYTEEAFTTLLSGPLSPDDPDRNEKIPAVLFIKLVARKQASAAFNWHFWLATGPREEVRFENGELLDATSGLLVRAHVHLPPAAVTSVLNVPDGEQSLRGIHAEIPFGAGNESATIMKFPFIPRLSAVERTQLARLDYESERARVIDYWRNVTMHSLPFTIPEKRFLSFGKANLVHILIGATKDPKSGLYMNPEASYVYAEFANGTAYHAARLDAYGDHRLAAKYLDTLVKLQGSRPLEGTYLGDQRWVYHGARVDADYDYTMGNYNLDHGTVLWGLAEHYFFTRDKEWVRGITASMEHAADWVIGQRKLTEILDGGEKIPEYGLLPAGHLEDNDDWWHWFAVNAVAVQGMTRMAQVLADLGAPEASYYAGEAAAYKRDLRDAVLRACRQAPVVRLRDNTYIPFVPVRPYERQRIFGPQLVGYYSRYRQKMTTMFRLSATREVFASPVMLLDAGIFEVNERLADWVLDDWEDNRTLSTPLGLNVHGWVDDEYWFSRGGMVWEANYQNPILAYVRRREVAAAIRVLYNDFVSCYYPDVNAFTEEYREWRHGSGPFYKSSDEARFLYRLRDFLVHEEGEELWLAAGAPRRWLADGQAIEVHGAPTYFGPVSYRLRSTQARVEASVELPVRNRFRAAWLVIRAPEGKKIRSVELDNEPWKDFDPASERIRLPLKSGPQQLSVNF